MQMTDEDVINNLLKKGNSKAFIVNLVYDKLRRNKSKLSKEQKKSLLKQAIQIVENAMRKSF